MSPLEGELTDLRLQAGPHVFVDDLESLHLAADDHHHLARSLRLRDGDPLTASDGQGQWRAARFGDALEPAGQVVSVPAPTYELALGVALAKAAKPEFSVQKATELGIDALFVFPGEHSVARWDASKRAKNLERLAVVAREAAMQSRRVRIPRITVFDSLASLVSAHAPQAAVRADFGGVPINSGHRCVLIGPEGGWSPAEVAEAPAAVDLGPTVLRAETASVVAAAFMAQIRSDATR